MEDTPNIGESMVENPGVYCKSANVSVLAANGKTPLITLNQFGAGKAMYMSSFRVSKESTRFLMRALLTLLGKEDKVRDYICDNLYTECAYYEEIDKLVVINNSGDTQKTVIKTAKGDVTVELAPFATKDFIIRRKT